jgi:hypothetical protein
VETLVASERAVHVIDCQCEVEHGGSLNVGCVKKANLEIEVLVLEWGFEESVW